MNKVYLCVRMKIIIQYGWVENKPGVLGTPK
jgi:hypothetical protein